MEYTALTVEKEDDYNDEFYPIELLPQGLC